MKIKLMRYNLNLSIVTHAVQYELLTQLCKRNNVKKFTAYDEPNRELAYKDVFIKPEGAEVDVITVELNETKLFRNQFNTGEDFRCFDWFEYVYPNKDIKRGYFVSNYSELEELRAQVNACGWCGHQEQLSDNLWCGKCRTVPGDQIHLTFLTPLSSAKKAKPSPEQLAARLDETWHYRIENPNSPAYVSAYESHMQKIDDSLAATKEKLLKEKVAFQSMFEEGVPIKFIKNAIYYSHNDTVCFGWREPLSIEDKEHLRTLLKNLTFTYTLK